MCSNKKKKLGYSSKGFGGGFLENLQEIIVLTKEQIIHPWEEIVLCV